MIQEFVDCFMERKPEVRDRLRQLGKHGWGGIEYKDIVRVVVENITEPHSYPPTPNPDRIHEIDDGYYQGMLLYVIAENDYRPGKYWYVTVDYGSCSGCDTLMRATECNEDDEQVLDDLMTLALHIVQGIKRLDDDQMKENMCSCNRSRDYDALLERYEKLEQVARDMYLFIALEDGLKDVTIRAQGKPRDKIYNLERFSEQLELLGVSVDD